MVMGNSEPERPRPCPHGTDRWQRLVRHTDVPISPTVINARKMEHTVRGRRWVSEASAGRAAAHPREFRTLVLRCPYGAQVGVLRATGAGDEEVGSGGSEAVGATSQGAGGRRWVPLEQSSCRKRQGTNWPGEGGSSIRVESQPGARQCASVSSCSPGAALSLCATFAGCVVRSRPTGDGAMVTPCTGRGSGPAAVLVGSPSAHGLEEQSKRRWHLRGRDAQVGFPVPLRSLMRCLCDRHFH